MPYSKRIVERLFAGALIVGSCLGCSNMNNTQKGAVVGTAGGAGLGAIIGKQLGNTGAGAAIGAVAGLAGGSLIGNAEDNKEQAEQAQAQAAYQQNVAARQARAVTNSDIISLAQEGVNDDIICNEIRTRGGNFDTSAQAIIYLQRAGVDSRVIQAMQNCHGY
jgi:hypothetical protein